MTQSIGIVTDSAADVPVELCEKYNIKVIPAYINFGLESIPDDGVTITRKQFYDRLKNAEVLPKTAAFSPGDAETALRQVLETYEHVFAIHITRKLSGIFESSRIAIDAIGGDRITIFDTGMASMGAGWQVIAAAEAAANGADKSEITALLESTRERVRLWAVPSTLDYLSRSGRVNSLIASLGEMLQIKPVIEVVDGEVIRVGRVRTFKKVFPKLVELAEAEKPLERLAILHLDNIEGAQILQEMMQGFAPADQTIVVWASSAVGANVGPGGVGLSLVRQKA